MAGSERASQVPASRGTPSGHAALGPVPESFFLASMEAIEAREPFAKGRARFVARSAAALAAALLPPEEVNAIRIGALLSDIGMLSVTEAILQKTDTLTPEERQIVRLHPAVGVEVVMHVPQLKAIVPLVLHHHEDDNGGGYPYGLSGEWISYGARIIRVVDAYDALMSLRPYRAAYSPAEALSILSTGAGVRFDPRIVTCGGSVPRPRHALALRLPAGKRASADVERSRHSPLGTGGPGGGRPHAGR